MWLIKKLMLKLEYKLDEAGAAIGTMIDTGIGRLMFVITTVPAAFVCSDYIIDFIFGDETKNMGGFRWFCLIIVFFFISLIALTLLQGLSVIFQGITELAGAYGVSYLIASIISWLLGYEMEGNEWNNILVGSTIILFLVSFGRSLFKRRKIRKKYSERVRREHENQEWSYLRKERKIKYAELEKLWDECSQADKMKINGIISILRIKTKSLKNAMKEDCKTLAATMRYTPEAAAYLTHYENLAFDVESCFVECDLLKGDPVLFSDENRSYISEAISEFPDFDAPEDRFFMEKYAADINDIKAMLKELEYFSHPENVHPERLSMPNGAVNLIN